MRNSTRAAVVLLTITALVGLGGATAGAGGQGGEGSADNITFCHRTNSNTNPYRVITTDISSQNGAADHLERHEGPLWEDTLKAEGTKWGDVIPPLTDGGEGSEAYEQWLDEGNTEDDWPAFRDSGCVATEDEAPTHDVTLDKVTTGGTAPAAETEFTFDVTCELAEEGEDVPVSVTITPGDAPEVVGDDIAEGDSCTITETDAKGATNTSFVVNGGAPVDDDSVTFLVGTTNVSVVATNDYPEPTVTPTDEPEVLGEVITKAPAQLPRTGAMTPYEAMAGAGFVLAGALALLASRRLTADAES